MVNIVYVANIVLAIYIVVQFAFSLAVKLDTGAIRPFRQARGFLERFEQKFLRTEVVSREEVCLCQPESVVCIGCSKVGSSVQEQWPRDED
jgi:hypothetical protein